MNNGKRFLLPLAIAIPSLAAGIAIGHFTTPVSSVSPALQGPSSSAPSLPLAAVDATLSQTEGNSPQTDSVESAVALAPADNSSESIITRIKGALGRPGGRRTYATFSKLADSI
ncbi:MAG: hypothetical protein M3Q89_04750, partial [Verrucomicrobiota bacterium]|nr:hypothetical protein [Verrucomicrobiota bacterium]